MWNSRLLTAVAMIAFVLPVQIPDRALGAVGDAEVILYRFTGVFDNTGPAATAFHCTNFSGVTETVRIVVRDGFAGVLANLADIVPHLQTRTYTTHQVILYGAQNSLSTGTIAGQGTAAIAATSTSIVCTAMTVEASSTSPAGIALHGVRFNPIPGTQE